MINRTRVAVAVLAATLTCAGAGQVMAAPGLTTGLSDGRYAAADDTTRQEAFGDTVTSGTGIVRLNLLWRNVVSGVPADPRNPADPAYDFTEFDRAVSGAVAENLEVLITVYAAPAYAEGSGAPGGVEGGTWRPDPTKFGDFAAAVATRYGGDFQGLPRVRYYQAWNEPNLPQYLTPQNSGGKPESPELYRELLNAFYAEVKRVQADNEVITAGTAPYGDPPGGERVRPLVFWRKVLCLANRKLKPANCPSRAKFDVLAHHPINTSGGPRRSAVNPDDASTPDLKHVVKTLRAAEKHHLTGTAGRHPIWATEIWWESNPPDTVEGISVARQAKWLEEALYILWKQGARTVINLQLQDEPFDRANPYGQNAAGILFPDGSAKPAFTAWRFPFIVDVREKGAMAWGRSPVAGKLTIERKQGGQWRAVAHRNVGPGSVFKTRLDAEVGQRFRAEVAGESSLRWRVR